MSFVKKIDYWADSKFMNFKAWVTYRDNDTFKYFFNMEINTLVPSGNYINVSLIAFFRKDFNKKSFFLDTKQIL